MSHSIRTHRPFNHLRTALALLLAMGAAMLGHNPFAVSTLTPRIEGSAVFRSTALSFSGAARHTGHSSFNSTGARFCGQWAALRVKLDMTLERTISTLAVLAAFLHFAPWLDLDVSGFLPLLGTVFDFSNEDLGQPPSRLRRSGGRWAPSALRPRLYALQNIRFWAKAGTSEIFTAESDGQPVVVKVTDNVALGEREEAFLNTLARQMDPIASLAPRVVSAGPLEDRDRDIPPIAAAWGSYALVTERAPGISMADHLRLLEGGLSERSTSRRREQEVLAVLNAAADGIAALESGQIFHRDLNPENVFVDVRKTGDEVRASVRFIDFGVSIARDFPLHSIPNSYRKFGIDDPSPAGIQEDKRDVFALMRLATRYGRTLGEENAAIAQWLSVLQSIHTLSAFSNGRGPSAEGLRRYLAASREWLGRSASPESKAAMGNALRQLQTETTDERTLFAPDDPQPRLLQSQA